MSNQLYLTAEGASRLREELGELKEVGRIEIAKRLRAAIQMGDLSENADYHKAKEDQGFLEGRIQELEYLLKNATIVEANSNGKRDTADIGATVTVIEEGYPAETYIIVGAKEADPRNGRISNESPIGSVLMGRRVGDRVQAETPGGNVTLEIIAIE